MSTPPPPPPPPSPFGNQPPPQQYGAPPPAYSAPPGYTPYGSPAAQGAVKPSKGLSKAMVILFFLTAASAVLVGIALFSRKGALDDYLSGASTLKDLENADAFAGLALILQFLATVPAAILTCLWSKRIADNARARGALNVNPGLAAGGWFIPIGNLFIGFDQLRKSVTGVGGTSKSLAIWQGLFISQAVVLVAINRLGQFDINAVEDVGSNFRNQGIVALIGAVLYFGAAIFAMKSAKEIDTAVTGG